MKNRTEDSQKLRLSCMDTMEHNNETDNDVLQIDNVSEDVFGLFIESAENPFRHNVFTRQNDSNFSIDLPFASLKIKQNRDLQSTPGVTGAAVWDGSIILASYLAKYRKQLGLTRESRCLELGSGCGLLGIYVNVGLGVDDIILTDLDVMLPLLKQNVEENDSKAAVLELDWDDDHTEHHRLCGKVLSSGDRQSSQDVANSKRRELGRDVERDGIYGRPFDFILAADCIYNEYMIDSFVSTLSALCTPGQTQVFLAVSLRDSEVMEVFLTAMMAQFRLERIVQTESPVDDSCTSTPKQHRAQEQEDTAALTLNPATGEGRGATPSTHKRRNGGSKGGKKGGRSTAPAGISNAGTSSAPRSAQFPSSGFVSRAVILYKATLVHS